MEWAPLIATYGPLTAGLVMLLALWRWVITPERRERRDDDRIARQEQLQLARTLQATAQTLERTAQTLSRTCVRDTTRGAA